MDSTIRRAVLRERANRELHGQMRTDRAPIMASRLEP
jgi:hypothetical protein